MKEEHDMPPTIHRDAERPNRDGRRRSWLWGFAGSDINFILYCLVLYKLKREVPMSDYREFRVLWWSVVLTVALTTLLLGLIEDWHFGVLLAKGISVALSVPSFLVMQKADLDGFVIHQFFGGVKTRGPYRPLIGILFFGSCALFLLTIQYKSTWEAVAAMTGVNGVILLLGFLIRNIRVAISEK